MIELHLVSGSLGAGKTTWLSAILSQNGSGPVDFVIVNELSGSGVDQFSLAGLTRTADARVIAIEGGCVCCDRREVLRRELRGVVGAMHADGRDGRVFLETSGVSELAPIIELISADPVLQNNIRLDTSTVLIDGVTGSSAVRHDRMVRERTRYADRVVISRADLVPADQIEQIGSLVRAVNPHAILVAAEEGLERQELNPEPVPSDDVDVSTSVDEHDVRAVAVEIAAATSWAEFAVWLHTLCTVHPQRIRRSKSVVPSARGLLLVQSVGPHIAIPSRAPDGATPGVTLLGIDIDSELISRSIEQWIPSAEVPHREGA